MLTIAATVSTALLGAVGVEATPVSVTVYPDRAWVERQVLVDLAAGAQEVVIRNLPPHIDANSIQASASGPAAVTDVQFHMTTVSAPAAERNALAKALQQAEDTLLQVMNHMSVLETEQSFLDGMQSKAMQAASDTAGTAALDTTAIKQQMEFIANQLTRVLDAKIVVRREQEAAQRQVDAARSALNASGGVSRQERTATIRLQVAGATASTITLTSLVTNASWSPIYDARIDSATGDVVLDYRAAVVQRTGEDWSDVTMTLSTAQPSSSLEPPSVGTWTVAEYVPPPAAPSAKLGQTRRRSAGIGGGGDAEALGIMAFGAEMDSVAETASFKLNAIVGGSPVNATYTLPGRVTVPSDGNADRRLQIGTTDLDGELVHLSVPGKTKEVFLLAEATNPGPYLLLTGPTNLFIDGGFVGRTNMPTTAKGERLELPFGPLPTLTAKRSVETNRGSTGFFKGTSQLVQTITIVLENAADQPVNIRVLDRRPVSQNEKIKVEVTNLSDPLSTDAEYVRDRQPKGVLRWDIEVPANAMGDSARTLTWTLDVRWPKDMTVTGL